MQKVFCCIFLRLKPFVKPRSLETIFTLSAYMKCQLWNTKKLENCAVLRSIQIITEIAGFQTYILHKYIHTLHFYKYQYRYITILTYRKLHTHKPIFYLVAFADRKRDDESIYVPATLNNTPVYCKRIQYIVCNSNSHLVI